MNGIRVLLVEDTKKWQDILSRQIKVVLPNSDLQTEATFQPAMSALNGGRWDLLVTDIGLPPDDEHHVLGKELVKRAGEMDVPCIVVSGTAAVTARLVRDFLKEYQARDFFSKEDLARMPDKRAEFQSLVLQCAGPALVVMDDPRRDDPKRDDESPAPKLPPARQVIIGSKAGLLYVNPAGIEDNHIPAGPLTKMFVLFANNVVEGFPANVVENSVLNTLVGEGPGQAASAVLRNSVRQLNDLFRKWARLEKGTRWVIKAPREHGYCLETKGIQWIVDKQLRKELNAGKSLWDVLVDPYKMANTVVDHEHRVP